MNQFKLGFGPMSHDIVEILCQYTVDNDYPLMIIASRNQVDYASGYVCTTAELAAKVKAYNHPKLLLCRDHCGTGFSDLDRGLPADAGLDRVLTTIKTDIESGFDLIHIDVSRIRENQLDVAAKLIDYAIQLNPNIKIEFGSEDNTGLDIDSSLARIDTQLLFLQQYKNNVVFFVTQTGSLTKSDQVGVFDVERNRVIAEQIHSAGFLFKEHNADYFVAEDINNRIQAGVDSLNIAPQLGCAQTALLQEFIWEHNQHLWDKFVDVVYAGNMWQRWVSAGVTDENIAVLAAGHYHFNSEEYRAIMESIDPVKFRAALTRKIVSLIEFYKAIDFDHPEVKFQAQLQKKLAELRARDPFIYR